MLGRDLKEPLLGPAFGCSEKHCASGTVREGASQGPAVTTFKEKVKMEEKNFSKRGQEVQTYNYKVNKSQRYDAQHGFYGK